MAKVGPVAVAIDAAHPEFRFYSSGVYYNSDCKNGVNDLDHGSFRSTVFFHFCLAANLLPYICVVSLSSFSSYLFSLLVPLCRPDREVRVVSHPSLTNWVRRGAGCGIRVFSRSRLLDCEEVRMLSFHML